MNEGVTSRGEANAISSENGPTMGITRSVMTTLDERYGASLREPICNSHQLGERSDNSVSNLRRGHPRIGKLFLDDSQATKVEPPMHANRYECHGH